VRHPNEATQRIANYIEHIFRAPEMHAASAEGLEMTLLTALHCYHLATGSVADGRVTNLWRFECKAIHGPGAQVRTLADLPGGKGKADRNQLGVILEPMRRIWVTLTDPVTTIASVRREL